MRRPAALAGLCVVVLVMATSGCASKSPAEGAASTEADIIGGSATSAQPAVGALVWLGREFCTAFLVAPQIVMTAGHCASVDGLPDGFFMGPGGGLTDLPQSLDELQAFRRVQIDDGAVHPSYQAGAVADFPAGITLDDAKTMMSHDVGLFVLHRPLAVRPLAISGDRVGDGQPCTAIGYGLDGEGGGLAKKRARVGATDESVFVEVSDITGHPTNGDSGSPLLCNGAVAGVFSFYWKADAGATTQNFYQSTSDLHDWVNEVADGWGVTGLP